MTGNKITLYKVPWAQGNIRQPYFLSDTARDTYFENLEKLEVNKPAVNIKLADNYLCEVIVDIDYTISMNYNFVKIIYNNTKFFGNIMDLELVSFNRSKLYIKRCVHIENTNFISNFKNFNIYKCLIPPDNNGVIDLTINKSFLDAPSFRYYKRKFSLDNFEITSPFVYKIEDDLSKDCSYYGLEPYFIPAIVVLRTYETTSGLTEFDGCFNDELLTRYGFDIIPLPTDSNAKTKDDSESGRRVISQESEFIYRQLYNGVNQQTKEPYIKYSYSRFTSNYDYLSPTNNRQSPATKLLDAISPYANSAFLTRILGYKVIDKEKFTEETGLPVYDRDTFILSGIFTENYKYSVDDKNAPTSLLQRVSLYSSFIIYENTKKYIEKVRLKYTKKLESSFIPRDYFDKFEFCFFNEKAVVNIDCKDFIYKENNSQYLGFSIDLYEIFSNNNTVLMCSLKANENTDDNSIISKTPYFNIMLNLMDNTDFAVDASASFNANNRYYDALTKNAIASTAWKGYSNAVSQILTGGAQGTMGIVNGLNYNNNQAANAVAALQNHNPVQFLNITNSGAFIQPLIGMGISNAIRGITGIIETTAQISLQQDRADLIKQQEQSKPSAVSGSFQSVAIFNQFEKFINCFIYSPFAEDYNHWIKNSQLYGYKCEVFAEEFDYIEFTYNGYMVINATAELKTSGINSRLFTEFNELLQNATFFIVS